MGEPDSNPPHDDDELTAEIETILRSDPEVARLSRRIQRAQRQLRKLCSHEAWQAYLTVEEVTNERYAYVSRLLVRRARGGDGSRARQDRDRRGRTR